MIPSLPYLDRYRNEGTRSYSPYAGYTEARPRYRPDSEVPAFGIPVYRIPAEELNVYKADPHPSLLDRYQAHQEIRFCVHPQLLDAGEEDPYLEWITSWSDPEWEIQVEPSSSTRTLYVQGVHPPHALKLHFPYRVSRYGRRMRDEVVEQAVAVSRVLQDGLSVMDSRFAFLREVLGITCKNLHPETPRQENWGFLVRELTPYPAVEEMRSLVPGFSLYGGDFFDPERPPLLHELLEGRDPRDFILDQIMLPIVRHWASCFLNFGFLLEPHGQNVLLELGEGENVLRVVHRDLNLGIDNRRRRELGISPDTANTYNHLETGEFASITYDKFMGGHFFRPLVACAQELDPKLREADFREPCREEFGRVFPEHRDYLPRTVHYFSEKRDRFEKPLFQDTGEPPAWRP